MYLEYVTLASSTALIPRLMLLGGSVVIRMPRVSGDIDVVWLHAKLHDELKSLTKLSQAYGLDSCIDGSSTAIP